MPKTKRANETRLRAVLFTDVVSSTELAREMGDVGWTRLLEAQRRVVRRLLRSTGGREVDTAGDGFFAVFDRTADAVRCLRGPPRDSGAGRTSGPVSML